jgi:hypothetical protein
VIVTAQVNVPVPDTVAPQLEIVAPELIVVLTVIPGVNPLPDTVTDTPLGPCVGESEIAGVVIVNGALALLKLPSDPVAVTVYGVTDVVPVIVTRQLNVPVPDTVAPQLVIVAPELIVVLTVTPGVNPLPDTVTDTPLGPCVGESVIAGIVTVNGALALSKLPSDPVAVTVYGVTDAVPVIVTRQLNVPVPDTVAPQLVIVAPELIVVVTVIPGVNPLPDTVTDSPLGPCVGESVIAGVVTVNVALAWSFPASDPVAVTVYAVTDAVPVIVTRQLNVPVPDTVAPQLVIVAPELTVAVTTFPGVNPVPDTVTDTPVGPWVGESAIVGIVIVNGPVALSKLPSDPVAVIV